MTLLSKQASVCTGVIPIADYVESSLSTLTGEELDAFAEMLPTEVHSTQRFCRHRNFLRFRWWVHCVKYGVNTACNSPRTQWNITRYCGMLNVCLFVIQYQFNIFNTKKLLRHIAIFWVHICRLGLTVAFCIFVGCLFCVVSTSASDCLERLVSEMTCCVGWGDETWVSEQFLNGTSAQYRLCSAILLKLYKS